MITVITNLEVAWDVLMALAIVGILCGWMWVLSGLMFKGHCWLLGTSPEELAKTSSDVDSATYLIVSDSFDSSGGSD
jgi:hypothetical protein